MNLLAEVSALSAAMLVVIAGLLAGIARAPGWGRARALSVVVLTAAAYGVGDVLTLAPGVPDRVLVWSSRAQLAVAGIHAAAWIPFTFGGAEGIWRGLPRPLRLLGILVAVLGTAGLFPGLAMGGGPEFVRVPSIAVEYANVRLTPFGSLAGVVIVGVIGLAFADTARRVRRGAPCTRVALAGFTLFYLCALADLGSGSGWWLLPPMANLGFQAALLPVTLQLIRDFVAHAKRLDQLTRDLATEVRARTDEVLRAQRELAESERHATVGRMAAAAAHDINNPLAYLVLNTDLLMEFARHHPLPDEAMESVAGIADGAARIKKAVEALRARTRWSPGLHVPVRADRALRVALKAASPDLHHAYRVSSEFASIPLVAGDEGQLMAAFAGVLSAAVLDGDPAFHGHSLSLAVRAGQTGSGDAEFVLQWELAAAGANQDAPPEAAIGRQRMRLRADEDLRSSRAIVEAHGGTMTVEEHHGLRRVILRLPACLQHVTPEGLVAPAPVLTGAGTLTRS